MFKVGSGSGISQIGSANLHGRHRHPIFNIVLNLYREHSIST